MSALLRMRRGTERLLRTAGRRWAHTDASATVTSDAQAAASSSEVAVAASAPAAAASTPAAAASPAATAAAAASVVRPAALARKPSRTAISPLLLRMNPRPPFLFLAAPLEDVSDSAWRRLVHAGGRGADLTFAEMARVENLARKSTNRTGTSWAKTAHNLEAMERDRVMRLIEENRPVPAEDESLLGPLTPTVVQLLANREDSLRAFLRAFVPVPGVFAGFNLNMGCPSPDVMSLGLGAQSVKRQAKAAKMVEILNEYLVRNCGGKEWAIPTLPGPGTSLEEGSGAVLQPLLPSVSIKLRMGANEREKSQGVHVSLIRALRGDTANGSRSESEVQASSGPVSHFILHGRHGNQHYESSCDLGGIARTILHTGASNVVANGDIHSLAQVRRCIEMGAAGVMIGRALVKDPVLVQRLKEGLRAVVPALPLLRGAASPVATQQLASSTVVAAPSSSSSSSSSSPSSSITPAPLTQDQSPSPGALTHLYLSYARSFATPEKYRFNVASRIGKEFVANPRGDQTVRGRARKEEERYQGEVENWERERMENEEKKRSVAATAAATGDSSIPSPRRPAAPPARPSVPLSSLFDPSPPPRASSSAPGARVHRDTRPGHFVPAWGSGHVATPNGVPRHQEQQRQNSRAASAKPAQARGGQFSQRDSRSSRPRGSSSSDRFGSGSPRGGQGKVKSAARW